MENVPTLFWPRASLILVFLLICVIHSPAYAAGTDAHRIPVMIVGLSHFASHEDLHNSKLADIMSPEHQREIREIVRNLARFHPTKVMIEQPYGDAKIVRQYRRYLKGRFMLGTNEVYQLGFRLAAISGNKSIYPIDTNTDFPFDFDGVKASAARHGQTAILSAAEAHVSQLIQRTNELEQHGTIGDLLHYLNTPAALDANASWYMYVDRIGSGKDYAGADLVAYWYARNLYIYANVMRSIDSPHDRALILLGAGHAAQLREYLRLSPDLELVDPEPYLK